MAIELISTVIPKNGQDFAIALANDIKGGIHSVNTIEERNAISIHRLAEGMLCYVKNEQKMYQYKNGTWVVFVTSSSSSAGGGGGGYWFGTTPPDDTNLIWIDTSGDNPDSNFTDDIVNEFREVISGLQAEIYELKVLVGQIIEGGYTPGGGGNGGPSGASGDNIITENNDTLVTENGDPIIIE